MMKSLKVLMIALALVTTARADEFATTQDAVAMVQKATQHIKTAGKEKAYADFSAKDQQYTDRDLYVVVYDMSGQVLAHGQNAKMVGKVLLDLKDADGKEFIKERVDLAKAHDHFWQDYKFTDPVTKKVLPKSMYCEKLDDTAVCAGIYKR
jgi:cytochrome c